MDFCGFLFFQNMNHLIVHTPLKTLNNYDHNLSLNPPPCSHIFPCCQSCKSWINKIGDPINNYQFVKLMRQDLKTISKKIIFKSMDKGHNVDNIFLVELGLHPPNVNDS